MYPGQHIPGNPILWWLNTVHPQLKATLDWQCEHMENNKNYIRDIIIYKLTKIQLYKWFNRTLQLQISSWRIIIKTKIFIRSPQCMYWDKICLWNMINCRRIVVLSLIIPFSLRKLHSLHEQLVKMCERLGVLRGTIIHQKLI